jgi:hypothetical protein
MGFDEVGVSLKSFQQYCCKGNDKGVLCRSTDLVELKHYKAAFLKVTEHYFQISYFPQFFNPLSDVYHRDESIN